MSLTLVKDEQVAIKRLTGALGAEVTGLKVVNLSAEDLKTIEQALIDHHVIVLRDQYLSAGELDAFARKLGAPHATPSEGKIKKGHPDFPDVVVLENVGYSKQVTHNWHSEASAWQRPPSFTLLGAHILPEAGGDTMFANQHLAYEALSEGLKAMIADVRALHAVYFEGVADSSALHPVVRTHPETGKPALYVSQYFTKHFENMSVEESRPLLEYLEEHSVREEFGYRHVWQAGDLLVWDNRSVQHRAVKDYGDAQRVMYHMEVKDELPV